MLWAFPYTEKPYDYQYVTVGMLADGFNDDKPHAGDEDKYRASGNTRARGGCDPA